MTALQAHPPAVVARLRQLTHRYGSTLANNGIDLDIPAGCMVGLIGPDGVGKSTLLGLVAGARKIQQGQVMVLDGDMAEAEHRRVSCSRIAYMPQGLGRNLYPTLSVFENIDFFGRLFGLSAGERKQRIAALLASTGMSAFAGRPAQKLSGGMKQKLGLCCALIHDPDLLILDEPTTGVDPLSRRQFWELIARIRRERPQMSVIVATAYMEEAEQYDWLVAMDAGRILATGTPQELLQRTGSQDLEQAFLRLLPPERLQGHQALVIPPLPQGEQEVVIDARGLRMQFGDFVAVDDVTLQVGRGEIFGFLGSNGCGKSTTMKMLTGLLEPSAGEALLLGQRMDASNMATRRRVGYMSQAFSLYTELSVRQNLQLHARLFHLPADTVPARINELARRFELTEVLDQQPDRLPLGIRQRLQLAVAVLHRPDVLILDEPTSGVDPVARDAFWALMVDLSRRDGVTIFISTHFMNEAQRCDRMSLMHAGRILASDTPEALTRARGAATLEEAFIGYLLEASGETAPPAAEASTNIASSADKQNNSNIKHHENISESAELATESIANRPATPAFSLQRLWSYVWRETLELQRDPVRATLALVGSLVLMVVIGLGINMDVESLRFAVLDHDQTSISRSYAQSLSGSRYFTERAPLASYDELDQRMRSGELSLALEIPPGFGRTVLAGKPAAIGAWFDGAMPQRGETVSGYVQGIHQHWLAEQARERTGLKLGSNVAVETRFRYNPDVKSLPAMAPAVMPMLLLMLPAMLTALAVVREKELGSIINLYTTPVTRVEFLLGKQLPYVLLAMLNYLLMCALAVFAFGVPITGSFATLTLAALLFSIIATGMGLLASAVTRSQIAAMFFALIGTIIPASQFSGLTDPVSSLEGVGRWVGEIYPATHMFAISRGVFSKALTLGDLTAAFTALALAIPVIMGIAIWALPKQER